MFHPELESMRGMLERPGQCVLKCGLPPLLAQALCSLCTHHLPLPFGTTAAHFYCWPAWERRNREGK